MLNAIVTISKNVCLIFNRCLLGNRPILLAPKFGLDDGSGSNFDVTLVLATMLISQLHEGNPSELAPAATTVHNQAMHRTGSEAQEERVRPNVPEHPSDHTRIWSDLSGNHSPSFYDAVFMLNLMHYSYQEVQQKAVMRLKKGK